MSKGVGGRDEGRESAAEMCILPGDVYDALHLSALAFGGIGAGMFCVEGDAPWDSAPIRTGNGTPVCAIGHAIFLDGQYRGPNCLADVVGNAMGGGAVNDGAFAPGEGRIPFREWCRRLNVVPDYAVPRKPKARGKSPSPQTLGDIR